MADTAHGNDINKGETSKNNQHFTDSNLAERYENDEEYGVDPAAGSEEETDDELDYVLEDSIIECLGKVLSLCIDLKIRDDISEEKQTELMLKGNRIYNRLLELCTANRDLFIFIYAGARDFKSHNNGSSCIMDYKEAVDRASREERSELLLAAAEFIHKFRVLVRERLLLVKPMLQNPDDASQVFASLTGFMCYESIFDPNFKNQVPDSVLKKLN